MKDTQREGSEFSFVSSVHFICGEPWIQEGYEHGISLKKKKKKKILAHANGQNATTQKVNWRVSGVGMSNHSKWVSRLVLSKTTWFMIISNMQKFLFLNTANMVTNLNSLKCECIIFFFPKMNLQRAKKVQVASWITLGK